MDDYNLLELTEGKNEWSIRLVNILTPLIYEGIQSIFAESLKLCMDNDEEEKYLMTFQNFLSRVPQWNNEIIANETKRITDKSNCPYLEDLITCVHVTHLKILTCMRVGKTQKKIEVNWPELNTFIHKIYICTARKIYTSVFLFEKDIMPLEVQKNRKQVETTIKDSICDTIRDSIPVEHLLRAYLDETTDLISTSQVKEEIVDASKNVIETDVSDTVENKILPEQKQRLAAEAKEKENEAVIKINKTEETPETPAEQKPMIKLDQNPLPPAPSTPLTPPQTKITIPTDIAPPALPAPASSGLANKSLSFNDADAAIYTNNVEETISAPKDINTLEQISNDRHEQRKQEEADDEDGDKLVIHGDDITLSSMDVHDLNTPLKINEPPILEDVEIVV